MNRFSLFLLLVLLCLLLNLGMLPYHLNYRHYICGDSGSSLFASALLHEGVTPWIDFNYNYGFATLWLNQLWFNTFGHTPLANTVLNLLCSSLLCWGLAEFIVALHCGKTVTWLLVLSTPYLFCYSWFTTAHTLEAALILLCLVQYLKRSYTSALLLATLALLVKPSLAYFAGLYLVVALLLDRENRTLARQAWTFLLKSLPSILLLLAYTGYVLVKWGGLVLLNSLLPLAGAQGYKESACGFFARGTMFWLPTTDIPSLLAHYLLTPAGAWIVSTLLLLYFTILTAIRWLQTRTLTTPQRCILFCGLLHLCFVFILFGNEWSWTYDTYLIIAGGTACLSTLPAISRLVVPVLTLFMVLSLSSIIQATSLGWTSTNHYADVHHLFLTPSMHQELLQLRSLAGRHRVLVMGRQGAPSLLLDGVHAIPTWAYMQQSAQNAERCGMLNQIDQADIIAVPLIPTVVVMTTWPEVAEHLQRLTFRKETENLLYLAIPEVKELLPR